VPKVENGSEAENQGDLTGIKRDSEGYCMENSRIWHDLIDI
jgi:hypothetical protein